EAAVVPVVLDAVVPPIDDVHVPDRPPGIAAGVHADAFPVGKRREVLHGDTGCVGTIGDTGFHETYGMVAGVTNRADAPGIDVKFSTVIPGASARLVTPATMPYVSWIVFQDAAGGNAPNASPPLQQMPAPPARCTTIWLVTGRTNCAVVASCPVPAARCSRS